MVCNAKKAFKLGVTVIVRWGVEEKSQEKGRQIPCVCVHTRWEANKEASTAICYTSGEIRMRIGRYRQWQGQRKAFFFFSPRWEQGRGGGIDKRKRSNPSSKQKKEEKSKPKLSIHKTKKELVAIKSLPRNKKASHKQKHHRPCTQQKQQIQDTHISHSTRLIRLRRFQPSTHKWKFRTAPRLTLCQPFIKGRLECARSTSPGPQSISVNAQNRFGTCRTGCGGWFG